MTNLLTSFVLACLLLVALESVRSRASDLTCNPARDLQPHLFIANEGKGKTGLLEITFWKLMFRKIEDI